MKRFLLILLFPLLAQADRPNIVIFLVDDMGVMDTSVPFLSDAGQPVTHPLNEWFRTPAMERLASQGIRFNNFYAQSVCSPTRVSIMTGQNAARHHTTQFIKPDGNNRGDFGPEAWRWEGIGEGAVTMPGVLGDAGYHTIHAGKGHFGPMKAHAEFPQNIGFTVNIAGHAWGAPASYYGKDNFAKAKANPRDVPGLEKYHGQDIFLTEALTIESKAALDAVPEDQPFLLYLSHYAVHSPFQADPRLKDGYDPAKAPMAGDPERQRGRATAVAFATMIEGMDKSLGDVLDHLDAIGKAENTLVFFLGDNGSDASFGGTHEIACAAPLRGKKGTHYEGGMRVPFIAAWAKRDEANPFQQKLAIPAGALQEQVAAVHDLLPTIAEVAGIAPPADHPLDGSSLATLLSGAPDPSRGESFLMHFPHQHRSSYFTSYRLGDWKLIHHYEPKSGDPRDELFHLAKDPSESNNLAESMPEQLERMRKAMGLALEAEGALYAVDAEGSALKP